MATPYREKLDKIRLAFPQPVSDRVHDSYFVHSIMRALDLVDVLKSEVPVLGPREPLDYGAAQRHACRMVVDRGRRNGESGRLFQRTDDLGPSAHADQRRAAAVDFLADRDGSDRTLQSKPGVGRVQPQSRACRGRGGGDVRGAHGLRSGARFRCVHLRRHRHDALRRQSRSGEGRARRHAKRRRRGRDHFCQRREPLLPLQHRRLARSRREKSYHHPDRLAQRDEASIVLRDQARTALQSGWPIAAIIATLGTTDAFGLDDLEAIVSLRDELVSEFNLPYRPHVHADAVIGWAWQVFSDYDFETNPLGFRPRTVRALAGACQRIRHLHLADSIGIDFHKTGFTPYISSLVLFKERDDLGLLSRSQDQMPYLYQFGEHRPGMFTLETSRGGMGALAALANLKLLGKEGLRVTIGHIVEMTQLLREHLEGHESTCVLNRDNFGTVTLFRAYPDGVDTFSIKDQEMTDEAFRETLLRHNDYNRKIYDYVHAEAMAGRGVVISLTDSYRETSYGEPVTALKSFILSPFTDEANVEAVVEKVLEARAKVKL